MIGSFLGERGTGGLGDWGEKEKRRKGEKEYRRLGDEGEQILLLPSF